MENDFSSIDSTVGQSNAGPSDSDASAGTSKGPAVRDRAGHVKNSLADALESGADKLRHRAAQTSNDDTLAGATNAGSAAIGDARLAQVSDRVASGMDKTADWLRDANLDGLRAGIETQVKEHPGRALLIAAGLGYLLGRALRK